MLYDDVYDELKQDFQVESKKSFSLSTYVFLLLILLVPLVIFLIVKKPYSFVSSFDNLPEPELIPVSWSATFKLFWKDFVVDFLESYDLKWKVIAVKDFNAVSDFSIKLSPKDYVLWWWFMWIQENIDKFTWDNESDDQIVLAFINSDYKERLDSIWWVSTFQKKYSNTRLIPSDKRTRSMLKRIDEWDIIWIKWYSAYVHTDDDSWKWWPSCTSVQNKWCEILYVTDITWLREM